MARSKNLDRSKRGGWLPLLCWAFLPSAPLWCSAWRRRRLLPTSSLIVSSRRRMRASSSRARPRLPGGRRWEGYWSDGRGRLPPSAWPQSSLPWRPSFSAAFRNPRGGPGMAPSPQGYQGRRRLRPGSPDAAPRVRYAVRLSTRGFSSSLRSLCLMWSAISGCRPPARASRSRCLALAWWWEPCAPSTAAPARSRCLAAFFDVETCLLRPWLGSSSGPSSPVVALAQHPRQA